MNKLQRTGLFGLLGSALLIPAVDAQQRIPDRPQVPPIPVEQAMERRAEQALRQLERIERQLPQAAQRAEERMQANVAEAMQRGVRGAGLPATARLPEILDITDSSGVLRYREIQIEPFVRIIQREWVLLAGAGDLQQLQQHHPDLLEYLHDSRTLSALGKELLTFRVPEGLDNQQSIERLLPHHLHDSLDRQHVYQLHTIATAKQVYQLPLPSVCDRQVRVGVIDTHLHSEHSGFAKARQQGRLVEYSPMEDYSALPTAHGTAITGFLIGEKAGLRPLLPAAKVFQVGAFYQQQGGHQGSKIEYLLAGIDWLLSQQVEVINMSLAGPPNNLLQQAIEAAVQRHVVVVAAVGNLGPHAPMQYPAAYPSVVAVTAVDQQGQVYPWAGQGEHVDFAAPGVNVPVLLADGDTTINSGTSVATPVVSAFAGCFQQNTVADTKVYLRGLTLEPSSSMPDTVLGYGVLRPQ
ncbi:MAG: S8 family serine peptidase [Idiomarina sp.]|nr:S8 family serine peptidase [Idiomarina sp.]